MVTVRGLSFGYGRGARLFTGLDLELAPGNVYGLLGRNGAGKTTLLKLLCGLRTPQAGGCRVFGHDSSRRPAALLEDLYFLPEEFYLPPLPARAYEELYAPFYPRFSHEALGAHMREFELENSKKLSEFSYGQKKKFLVAFGLATGARLLLLDEPTNGMDIPSKGQFRRLLATAGTEDRIVLVSTHQVRDMENLIDPVIILDGGRIIFQRSLEEVGRRMRMTLEPVAPEDALYADKALGGYVVVRPNIDGDETRIDLEVLFNAVIATREKVAQLFAARKEA